MFCNAKPRICFHSMLPTLLIQAILTLAQANGVIRPFLTQKGLFRSLSDALLATLLA